MYTKKKEKILEKKLGIPPDFQYRALTSRNFLRSNWHKNKLFVLGTLLNFSKQMTVLDLGAGSGNFERFFHSKVKKIVAIDYSNEVIDYLKRELKSKNIRNVVLLNQDIRGLSFRNKEKFDIILLIEVLEHIEIKDAERLLESLRGQLKEGGEICVVVPNYGGLWKLTGKLLDWLAPQYKMEEEQHLIKFSRESLEKVFEKCGYKAERISSFNLFSFLSPFLLLTEFLCRLELFLPFCWGNLLVGIFSHE